MGALFSRCGLYRYRLDRDVEGGGTKRVLVIGLNPSKAGADNPDLTVTKLVHFGGLWGAYRVDVGNMFGLVSTDPRGLGASLDPVGPENDGHLAELVKLADQVVVAWGAGTSVHLPLFQARVRGLCTTTLRGVELWCLGTTASGQPRHPSRLAYATKLQRWRQP